jgi:hypothetical protein
MAPSSEHVNDVLPSWFCAKLAKFLGCMLIYNELKILNWFPVKNTVHTNDHSLRFIKKTKFLCIISLIGHDMNIPALKIEIEAAG